MPTVSCPVAGFEQVTVTYPDEWLFEHEDRFWEASKNVPENASVRNRDIYIVLHLCDQITGIPDLEEILDARPLDYEVFGKIKRQHLKFLDWLRFTIIPSYIESDEVPKNL